MTLLSTPGPLGAGAGSLQGLGAQFLHWGTPVLPLPVRPQGARRPWKAEAPFS